MKETSPFHQQVPEGPATRVQVLRTYAPAEDCSDLQADSSPNSSSSGVVLITRVGSICRSTTSLVTTHLLTSRRLGSSNMMFIKVSSIMAVSYTHLRAHETVLDLVCRLLLEKKKKKK